MPGESKDAAAARAWTAAYRTGYLHDRWFTSREPSLSEAERALFDRYAPDLSSVIINVGCGNGRESLALRRLGYHKVTGVDFSEEMVELAMENASKLGLIVEFQQGLAGRLPFQDASADVVTLFANVLGHVTPYAARVEAFAEASRVLRTGGRMMIVVASLSHLLVPRLALPLMDGVHLIYNPHHLEKGDKLIRGAKDNPPPHVRSHWFRGGEVDVQAARLGLEILLSTTRAGVITGTRALRGAGDLVYVLVKSREVAVEH